MANGEDVKEFPDVNHKLAAPKKVSAFEKERQAAEAKRLRAEEENAAALRAFQDSFGDEEDDDLLSSGLGVRPPPTGPRAGNSGYGDRDAHYDMPPPGPLKSGPGSLGSFSGQIAPSLKRKRALDEMREAHEARREDGLLDQRGSGGDLNPGAEEGAQPAEGEEDSARPTVQLSGLPLNSTSRSVERLLGGHHLKVHTVHFPPPADPGTPVRRSLSAIATLDADSASGLIDTAVSALKDKYLGHGFYLSISRHLSSAALHPSMLATAHSSSIEPFGAEMLRNDNRSAVRNAPPPPVRQAFAPPDYYDSPAWPAHNSSSRPDALVNVQAPLNIETVRAIHVLAECLLAEQDPQHAIEIEAELMGMQTVQHDERFSFMYDSSSLAGVYYRYLLWGPELDGDPKVQARHTNDAYRVFDDSYTDWSSPHQDVPFPDLSSLAQVVTDIDYVSSDEESDDEGGERRFNDRRDGDEGNERKEHLHPVKRARFIHLLSRVPTINARLRKGDVARVTSFAITHAGEGAEEIVDLLLLNVAKPFPHSLASKYENSSDERENDDEEDDYEPGDELPSFDSDLPRSLKNHSRRDEDPSNAKLVALYLISDILSASSTAGARNAWKYRQLFELGFKAQNIFEHLGRLDKELSWGRLKAEQWKRKVSVIFGIWEGWSVFSSEVHEELKQSFLEPPMSVAERGLIAEREREEKQRGEEKLRGKFKRVGGLSESTRSASPASVATPAVVEQVARGDNVATADEDMDGAPMLDDLDGAPMPEDVDGQPMDEMDGAPMPDHAESATMSVDEPDKVESVEPTAEKVGFSMSGNKSTLKPSGSKRRMRAEDMFADSDGE